MNPEYDPILEFDRLMDEIDNEPPVDEMQEVLRYLHNVAQHMGMDPNDLHRQILKEWAYSRSFGREV